MPNLSSYKKILGMSGGNTVGQVHKTESDMIMEATWDNDLESQTAYIYDFFHDSEPLKLIGLNPSKDHLKTPVKIKYLANSSQTFDKDQITYHIQFKPSHRCEVSYYKEEFEDRYNGTYPLGLYCDIKDNHGIYNRWLIVNKANFYDPQFSTFEVLPCDYIFQWVKNGERRQMAGVLRSQNS